MIITTIMSVPVSYKDKDGKTKQVALRPGSHAYPMLDHKCPMVAQQLRVYRKHGRIGFDEILAPVTTGWLRGGDPIDLKYDWICSWCEETIKRDPKKPWYCPHCDVDFDDPATKHLKKPTEEPEVVEKYKKTSRPAKKTRKKKAADKSGWEVSNPDSSGGGSEVSE